MRYLIYLILVVSASSQAGTIQKWVDENGNVHYGDTPPVSAKTKDVNVQSAPSNPGKPLPRLSNEQGGDSAAAGGDAEADQQEVASEQAAAICERARADLDILNNNTNIRLQLADGTSRDLDQTEVDQRRTKAQAEVSRYCN
jgi:hypothetical protein